MVRADTISKAEFQTGMRQFASSVCVVTTDNGLERHGITVTSQTSVSIEPPTLLVCIHRDSCCAAAIVASGVFCVNLLSDGAHTTAQLFAGATKAPREVRFNLVDWEKGSASGCPVLAHALRAFECRLVKTIDVATHRVFFGAVVSSYAREGAPLLYANRAFGRLAFTNPMLT